MMASERKVLIVEDERMIAEYFRVVVERLGYVVCGIAGTADDAVRLAAEEDPSVVFIDVRLPGERDGVDAALEIHSNRPVPMVFITGSQEPATMGRIKSDHPADVLLKPVLEPQLSEALAKHCPLA